MGPCNEPVTVNVARVSLRIFLYGGGLEACLHTCEKHLSVSSGLAIHPCVSSCIHGMDFCETLCWRLSLRSVEKLKIWLQSDRHITYLKLRSEYISLFMVTLNCCKALCSSEMVWGC